MSGDVKRLDLLWLVAAIWFGLGVAHDNLTLKIGGIVVFVFAQQRRGNERGSE